MHYRIRWGQILRIKMVEFGIRLLFFIIVMKIKQQELE
jgi:hypothetical protein